MPTDSTLMKPSLQNVVSSRKFYIPLLAIKEGEIEPPQYGMQILQNTPLAAIH